MRAVSVAIATSVLVHAAALAWVAYDVEDAEVPVLATATIEQAQPQPDPVPEEIVVTFFHYDGSAASNGGEGIAVSSAAGTNAPAKRISTGKASGEEIAQPGETKTPSPWMKMRKPGDEPLKGLSGSFWAKFAENTKPLPPPPDIPGERVGNEIADLRARLKRAGRYSPDELAGMRAELVAKNAEREAEELKPAGGGTYKTEKETFRAKVNADGSVKLEDKPENMDSQDKMMLEHGIDPYARNKLAYLDRTREQRYAIGKQYREEQLKKSVLYMNGHIRRLFAMTNDEAKRKQGLFDLWDECMETGTPEEIAGGESARAHVMAYIRAKVKYTPEEVAKLNATRHSKQPFEP